MVVQWFVEFALNRDVLGSIPATSQKSQKFKVNLRFKNLLGANALKNRFEDTLPLASLMLL